MRKGEGADRQRAKVMGNFTTVDGRDALICKQRSNDPDICIFIVVVIIMSNTAATEVDASGMNGQLHCTLHTN